MTIKQSIKQSLPTCAEIVYTATKKSFFFSAIAFKNTKTALKCVL